MGDDRRAIIVLGMHRSGTSCLSGMLAGGGLASAGAAVRNWDNARGHHEMLDVVRLDEAVLAHSGGHWLSPPSQVRWTDEHAATRDRLLRTRIDGRPALIKDPRILLTLPFWRASSVPFHVVGIVRHPLAVARSLASWRAMPLAAGVALWSAHNRALADDRARHGTRVVDFDAPKADVVAAVVAACASFAPAIDRGGLAGAYEELLVHHDRDDPSPVAGLVDAVALYHRLGGVSHSVRPAFPRAELASFERLLGRGAIRESLDPARAALSSIADAAAILVPVVAALVHRGAHAAAAELIAEHASRLDDGLADLLLGKVLLLARTDAASAVRHLEAACAAPRPYFQARNLLAHALRAAGRHADARAAMLEVAGDALYSHGPLATLAEWRWLDGDREAALAEMQRAIAAAPNHRRGRLRTRLAAWLLERGDRGAARDQLVLALDEDPTYERSRTILTTL